MGIALGIFILGVSIVIFAFNNVRNISIDSKNKQKDVTFKETKVWKALVKKEVILLTKNADYTFSFTGLLLVQPFLTFLVKSNLNSAFEIAS